MFFRRKCTAFAPRRLYLNTKPAPIIAFGGSHIQPALSNRRFQWPQQGPEKSEETKRII